MALHSILYTQIWIEPKYKKKSIFLTSYMMMIFSTYILHTIIIFRVWAMLLLLLWLLCVCLLLKKLHYKILQRDEETKIEKLTCLFRGGYCLCGMGFCLHFKVSTSKGDIYFVNCYNCVSFIGCYFDLISCSN